MTRTERSISPRALRRDRSENKEGVDTGMRKGGAGAHNWGSIDEEARIYALHSWQALYDFAPEVYIG